MVVISISKGPKIVKPKNGKFKFDDVYQDSPDNMKASIRKEDGILYIDCDVIFESFEGKYKVPNKGFASTNQDLLFSIPIKITNISQSFHGNFSSHNKFTIEIPLDELGDSEPTRIYLNLDKTEPVRYGEAVVQQTTRMRAWFALEW